jgi:hypothetical protein
MAEFVAALSMDGNGLENTHDLLLQAKQDLVVAQSTKASACILAAFGRGLKSATLHGALRAELREFRAEGGEFPLNEHLYLHGAILKAVSTALSQ